MHVHITSLLKKTQLIYEGVTACGKADKIYLVTTENNTEPIEEVRNELTKHNYKVIVTYVDEFDIHSVILTIKRIHEFETEAAKEKGYKVSFSMNITGGTKIMAAAECIAANIIGGIELIYIIWDDEKAFEEKIVRLPMSSKINPDDLGVDEKRILGFMLKERERKSIVTNNSVAFEFYDGSKQKASYHLRKLGEYGLVEYDDCVPGKKTSRGSPDKRSKEIRLTDTGILYAKWLL